MPLLQNVENRPVHLTPREYEVLELVCQGRSSKQVAAQLGISVRTVELHRARACGKLGLKGKRATLEWARVRREA